MAPIFRCTDKTRLPFRLKTIPLNSVTALVASCSVPWLRMQKVPFLGMSMLSSSKALAICSGAPDSMTLRSRKPWLKSWPKLLGRDRLT